MPIFCSFLKTAHTCMQTCVSLLIAAEDWWCKKKKKKKKKLCCLLCWREFGAAVCMGVCVCEGEGGGNLSCFCIDVAAFACLWLNSVSSTSVSFGEGCMYVFRRRVYICVFKTMWNVWLLIKDVFESIIFRDCLDFFHTRDSASTCRLLPLK